MLSAAATFWWKKHVTVTLQKNITTNQIIINDMALVIYITGYQFALVRL
jgi:hypothetical protein